MPSGLLINYYGEEPFTPPTNTPYDPAVPSVVHSEQRTSKILWQKYRNLIPIIRIK